MEQKQISNWTSNGVKISKSSHHTDMYILSKDGISFWNITASQDYMVTKYPIDKKKK